MVEGRLLSVNVGAVRQIELAGQARTTAIWKSPVSDRVAVRGVNLVGDDQADRHAHGGPDKAVYAYAREDYAWWERQLDRTLDPGMFGENLTTERIDLTDALVGERWRVGSVVLQVTSPRVPCWKLGVRMGDPRFPARFAAAGRPGAYLAILEEGEIGAGDRVQVIHRPGHGVTVGLVAASYHRDHRLAARILAAPELSEAWRHWAEGTVALAASASERRDCRHENPPPSPHASPSIRLRRLPFPTRRDRAGGPLVSPLRPVLPRRRRTPRRPRVEVDHVTVYRWVLRFTPLLAEAARPCRHAVGDRWQVDETYVKVAGRWRHVYRAIDQFGQIIDVFVSSRRDADAARRFFQQAIGPTKMTPIEVITDRAAAYPAVLDELLPMAWHRTEQYANNRVEATTAG